MKTTLKVLRIIVGIFFAFSASVGVTRIAIAGHLFSYYGLGVALAGAVSFACLRPMTTLVRITRVVIGLWFIACTLFGVVVLASVNGSLATTGPLRDVIMLALLACGCLEAEVKALTHRIRDRYSKEKISQPAS